MKIISWNVNGIRAVHNKGLFVPFIKKYQPDVLCLQETKAQQAQSEIDLPDYQEYWNSATRPGYSGTAIFVKATAFGGVPSKGGKKPLSVMNGLPEKIAKKYGLSRDTYGDPNTEGRVITAELKKCYVVSVYTPNSKDDLSRIPLRHKKWDPAFLEYMKELENPSASSGRPAKPVVFCGDLNVAHTEDDLANPKPNIGKKGFTQEEREGIDNMIGAGFIDTFRIFTQGNGYYSWWSHFANSRARNVGWRIDYIFASKKLKPKIKKALIHANVFGSDHCPVEIEITI